MAPLSLEQQGVTEWDALKTTRWKILQTNKKKKKRRKRLENKPVESNRRIFVPREIARGIQNVSEFEKRVSGIPTGEKRAQTLDTKAWNNYCDPHNKQLRL